LGSGGQISPLSIDFHRRPYNTVDHQKLFLVIVASDYLGNPYGSAKFGVKSVHGGLLGKWVKYNEFYLSIYLFIYTFL